MVPADDFDTRAYQLERELRLSLSKAYQDAADAVDLDALTDAILAGDEEAILAILNIDEGLQTTLEHALGSLMIYGLLGGVVIAMQAFASRYGSRVDTSSEAARLREELRRNVITPLSQRAYRAVLATMRELLGSGLDPYDIAEALRQSISLAPDQATSAARFRRAFHDAMTDPQRMVTGDIITIPATSRYTFQRRHNSFLNAAQRSVIAKAYNEGVTEKGVARLVNRHAKALANYRLDVIARQESIRAINVGEYLAYRQGRANRSLPRTARRYWKTVGDERVRHDHRMVPAMNAEGVGVGQMFQTPRGPVLYPPLEVNCRCRVVVRWPDLAGQE